MAETCDFEAMSATTEAHERLKAFEGTFKAEVTMWMGPGDPMVSTGTMTNEMDLGGRFLQQTYQGDPSDGPFPEFEGRGFWGYNTLTSTYEGFWIDTACTLMQTEQGDVDASGKVWTMCGEMASPQGGTMKKRSVITLIDDDRHSMEMFMDCGQGSEMKTMEIQYERA